MNAALATKAGKALILASTMTIAINAAVSASTASAAVPLGSQATLSLSSLYLNAPSGAVTFNTLPFQVGSAWQLGFGQSATAPASFAKPLSVAVLVNTSNTYYWYQGDTAGQVVLTFSDGSTQTTNLVVGSNVRDWDTGAGFAVNTVTDTASTPAWTGSTTSGDSAVIDMLTIPVATTTANLVSVTVTNANSCCDPFILVDGISVTYDPATPATVRPGNSGNTQAQNHSQAAAHSNSWIFTGQNPSQGNGVGGAKAQSLNHPKKS
jgi:hypothetical protein